MEKRRWLDSNNICWWLSPYSSKYKDEYAMIIRHTEKYFIQDSETRQTIGPFPTLEVAKCAYIMLYGEN